MKKKSLFLISLLVLGLLVTSCESNGDKDLSDSGKYNVVTTTTLVGDLVKNIGQDHINVKSLMGLGVDPHMYNASAGDVSLMHEADMVIYNGLNLEGKMGEVFENLRNRDKLILAIGNEIDKAELLEWPEYPGNYDPHIWFDVENWKTAALGVTEVLKELDPENSEDFDRNLETHLAELDELIQYIEDRKEELPEEKRVLVTAHDAFNYFGNAYGFKVKGLQGINTSTEAATSDVRNLANYIVENEIKAIFIESSVPRKSIEALQEAVKAQGFNVEIGGELYSDSTGDVGTPAETYIGTFKENIDTIVDALK